MLVTCLYLLALLSISGVVAMQSASLMAQQSRAMDVHAHKLAVAESRLAATEARLLAGDAVAIGARPVGPACGSRLRVFLLHERPLSVPDASWVVYGIQACADGRALVESTLGLVQPVGAVDEADEGILPTNLTPGRLSWRAVW